MSRDDATEAQVRAADPALSTWLTANAGSGKTRVLTDRVARLLLGGTDPQKILCLTYTKAAASEMQNRLFRRLGNWAMLDENALRKQLAELGVGGFVDRDTLARARRLFARAIETPGGLKIQTIHSFCASLLRRFPIEARVSPDFTEMDDRAATLLRQDILEEMAAGEDVDAVDALADLNPGEDLAAVLAEICRNSAGFAGPVPDLASGATRESLLAQAFLGDETALMGALIPLLAASSTNDSKAATALADLSFAPPTMATLAGLEGVVLTKSGAAPFTAKIGRFPTKPLASGAALHLMPAIEALMLRVEAARPARLAIAATEKTAALHRFARAFLPRYEERKAAQGLLDFDDLIARSAALLADRSVAAWVLYRLDGGIDQILVDEAQDTSPGQWQVIERLAEEFTAGEGARSQDRRLFVVGDEKQSIYSFQGANLKAFREMRDIFAARHLALAAPFQDAALVHSFRSSTAILNVVDSAFDGPAGHGLGGPPRHLAFNVKLPGRVDLWQPIAVTEEPEAAEWDDPVDQLPARHHTIVLAEKIAGEIRAMIDSGVQIPMRDGERPVHEGDFLILVRRRSPLFHAIIRACKSAGLRIAGADRLRLGAELAVKDLTALLSFLATPEDDLSLAAVLRSPLFGWSEAALFDLAHRRPDSAFLWQALRDRASEFLPTMAVLETCAIRPTSCGPMNCLSGY
jgi:ATP-dependent helicase/nuclease subunit A